MLHHNTIFSQILKLVSRHEFKFKNKLFSLDASLIDVSIFPILLQKYINGVGKLELFFKWIKQKIKSFIGNSDNAVMTQIMIALWVYLILAYLKFQSKLQKSMKRILRLLQLNLFEKRDLMALLRGELPDKCQINSSQLVLL